jgi:hypothetical protein
MTELLQYIIYIDFEGTGHLTERSVVSATYEHQISALRRAGKRSVHGQKKKKKVAAGTSPIRCSNFFVPS